MSERFELKIYTRNYGYVEVDADSLDEAKKKVLENWDEYASQITENEGWGVMEDGREGAWVLRIYMEETDETCIRLFHSRKAAVEYVKSIVDWNWEVEYDGNVAGKPAWIREAEKSLEEEGYWNDDGTLYVLSEEKFIG